MIMKKKQLIYNPVYIVQGGTGVIVRNTQMKKVLMSS